MKTFLYAAFLCGIAASVCAAAPAPSPAPAPTDAVSCPRYVLVDALNMIDQPSKYRDGAISEGVKLVECLHPPVAPTVAPADKPAPAKKAEPAKQK